MRKDPLPICIKFGGNIISRVLAFITLTTIKC
jgi:hypothetical protein